MTGLVEFLTARLDEDEQVALEATASGYGDWRLSVLDDDYKHDQVVVSPSRVLSEVAAKRSLIDEIESYEAKIEGEWGSGRAGSGFGDWESALRFLAAPYADHPEFDESWRVAAIGRDRETT